MRSNVAIVRDRQQAIRRELDRRGIAMKAVSHDSGIPYPTLLTYFPEPGGREPAQIPGGAIYALCGALPSDLLSLLLRDGFQIVRVPEEIDHDELQRRCDDFCRTKMKAHRADSPAGPEIARCEDTELRQKAGHLQVVR